MTSGWAGEARRWAGQASWPTAVSVATTLFTFVGLSLLLRSLAAAEAGKLAILLAVVDILSLIALHGSTTIIIRVYSGAEAGSHDWTKDLGSTLLISAPLALAGLVISTLLYDVDRVQLIYLALVLPAGLATQLATSFLNARGYYTWSSALVRLPNVFLLLPGLATLTPARPGLDTVLLVHLGGTLAVLALSLFIVSRRLQRGPASITPRQHLEGIVFLASSASLLASDQGLTGLGGALLPAGQIAVFAAMAILLRPFRLVRSVLTQIMMPEFIREKGTRYGQLAVGLWTLALTAALAASLVVPPAARWFYGGRYADGVRLIPILALAGALHLTSLLPRADLSGRAPAGLVARYVSVQAVVLVATLAAAALLTLRSGVLGLSWSLVLTEGGVNLVSYAYWRRFLHESAVADEDG